MSLKEWIKYIAPASPRNEDDVLGIFSAPSLRPMAPLVLGSAVRKPVYEVKAFCRLTLALLSSTVSHYHPPPSFSHEALLLPDQPLVLSSPCLHTYPNPTLSSVQIKCVLFSATKPPLELISPSSQAPHPTIFLCLWWPSLSTWFYSCLCTLNPLPRISSSRTV